MTLKSSLCRFGQRPPERLRNFYNPTTPQRVHAALWNAESWSNCPRANVHRKHWGIFYKIDLHWLWISHLLLSASRKASSIAHVPPKPPSLLISPDLAKVKVMQCWHVVPAPKKKKEKKSPWGGKYPAHAGWCDEHYEHLLGRAQRSCPPHIGLQSSAAH